MDKKKEKDRTKQDHNLGDIEEKVREVQDIIERAVDSRNYQKLNQSITQMVNRTVSQYQKEHPAPGGGYKKSEKNAAPAVSKETEPGRELYAKLGGERVKSILFIVFGSILTGSMAIGLLTIQILQAVMERSNPVSTAVTLAGTAAGLFMLGSGCSQLGRLSRFKKYVRTLGTKTYCDFQTLAGAVGRSVKYVKRDIKKMIKTGWFSEGRTDEKETCLITSRETYRQYEETQKALELKKEQQKKQDEERMKTPPQVQEVLDRGEEYLEKLRRSNDAIPGEEISAKIDKMEQIVDKIFERVQEHPEVIPDLRRMMDYYLPMTVKLLDAYEDMDSQPVQGETIRSSKKEIEDTLDTLNEAFAKLLDSIFQDTAWDVSSDISVLHTILAQEGLKNSDFVKQQNR